MFEFHVKLVFIFLAYGGAFLSMALAIALQWRKDSELPFTTALPALAAFAFLQGGVQAFNVLAMPGMDMSALDADSWVLDTVRISLLGASYTFLLWFGIDLVARPNPSWLRARWVAPVLFLAWGAGSLAAVQQGRIPGSEWPSITDCLARYILALPGGFMAVWGMHRQKRVFDRLEMPRAGMDSIWAGALFGLYTLLNTLATMRMPLSDSGMTDDGLFSNADWLFPTQVIQAVVAASIAFFVLRIVHAYKEELRLQVEQAERERYLAQRDALEAHQKVAEQLRQWNEILERRVVERTNDLLRRQKEAEALHRIGTEISALRDLDTILRTVVDNARVLLRADFATVTIIENGGEGIQVRTASGNRSGSIDRVAVTSGQGLLGKVLLSGSIFRTEDYLSSMDLEHTAELDAVAVSEGLRAHLAAPVRDGDRVLGVLCVASRGNRIFNDEDEWLIARLTLMTSIAVQNSRLHAEAQRVAVLEERERIGREIHDGLAQVLGYLGMMFDTVQTRLERGQVARVRGDLAEMEQLARTAYVDSREAILGLRVSAYGGQGLMGALQEYLRRFKQQSGLAPSLCVGPDWPHALVGDAEIQIMRIVQEALSNVRKHAVASTVLVQLDARDGWAEISVEDDGRGFDAERCDGCHFGMQTMRERAVSVGGDLMVNSTPGRGTRVTLRVPLRESTYLGAKAQGAVA